ncbi:MAG: alpha-amylase family glycosyl hydrolase [Succinivibrionaceae bacterium]
MNKLSKIAMIVASVALFGCNNTEQADINKKFWTPKEVVCKRSIDSTPVTITDGNLVLTKNNLTGCFNSNDPKCNVRIYQIMVESFAKGGTAPAYTTSWGPSEHGGTLRGIINNLSYIKSTGVNAIWMTPIFYTEPYPNQNTDYNKLDGTGYYTSNFFAIDPRFGTKEELKELVEKAHNLGLYVFLDGAFGHAKVNVSLESPNGNRLVLRKMCREVKGFMDKMSLKLGTCVDPERSLEFIKDVATYWIREVKIDGWRLDQSYQIEPKYWKKITKAVKEESAKPENAYTNSNGKKVQPLGYMVGEVWSDDPIDLENNAFVNNSLTSAFNFPLRHQLVQTLSVHKDICSQPAKDLDKIIKKQNLYTRTAMPNNFIGNHDLVRFGDTLQRAKYEKDGEKTPSYYAAHQAALSFLVASSGPLTIYYGEEIGDDVPKFDIEAMNCADNNLCDDHVARTTGRTSNLTKDEIKLKTTVKKMLEYRDAHPALSQGSRTFIYGDDSLFIDLKEKGKDKVIYVLNTSSQPRTIKFDKTAWNKLRLGNHCIMIDMETNNPIQNQTIVAQPISGSFYNIFCKK